MTEPTDDKAANRRGPLNDLLVAKLPEYCGKNGRLKVYRLCEAVGVSPQGIYKWLDRNRVSAASVKKLVALSTAPSNVLLLSGDTEPAKFADFEAFMFA